MAEQVHILNGDALKERFPKSINGELIVTRECLVDGNVTGDTLEEFYTNRAKFLDENYGDYSIKTYQEKTASEFDKIKAIPKGAEIYLWFEDDLFCQVNFWFVSSLFFNSGKKHSIFLVRPLEHHPYSFGHHRDEELISLFQNKVPIDSLEGFNSLWKHYKHQQLGNLLTVAKKLNNTYSFILPAVKAHIDRFPEDGKISRPKQSLLNIIKELNTTEFTPIYREFYKREGIYGFGDLQIKRLFDLVINI